VIEFRLLGSMELTAESGQSILPILAQPKRAALLAYLALAEPRGFHRRDMILTLFWPECDEHHARGALNKSLHFLRKFLGESLIISRGDGEVSLDWTGIWCGARAFRQAVSDREWREALRLYRGDLLDGFHVSGCDGFQHWLDAERVRYRDFAAGAAWALAHQKLEGGELVESERMAHRALGLVCTDESDVRRFISALARAGDRAAALKFFERFERMLWRELQIEPSGRTREVIERIRSPASKPQ
jgi:serine/threonine-protein kinase